MDNRTVRERFLNFIPNRPKDGCWEWGGARDKKGYGSFHLKRNMGAHRASLIIFRKRELSTDQHVMHLCHNPTCVNPDHLKIGTPKENTLSSFKDGRGLRKLSARNITDIRKSKKSTKFLAEKYGVDKSLINWYRKGTRSARCNIDSGKLKKWQVERIRKLRAEGCAVSYLVEKFKISKSQINRIVRHESWPLAYAGQKGEDNA